MTGVHRPFRRTHTMEFIGCRNKSALLSPATEAGNRRLSRLVVNHIEEAGFTVVRHGRAQRPRWDFAPFGPGYGYTGTAILSESHFAVHTYPEKLYDELLEVELNLCYLTRDHMPKVLKLLDIFNEWTRAKQTKIIHSDERYFKP